MTKDSLLHNTIIKNIQEYVYGILLHRDHLFMTNRNKFTVNPVLALRTNRLPRYLGVSVLKTPNIFHNLIKFCLHVMKGTLRITLLMFDSFLSPIETVGYSKGQPTPYSNNSKNVAFAILYAKDTAFDNIRNIVLPQNRLSDP